VGTFAGTEGTVTEEDVEPKDAITVSATWTRAGPAPAPAPKQRTAVSGRGPGGGFFSRIPVHRLGYSLEAPGGQLLPPDRPVK